jgi:hypothetical protein
MSLLDILLIAVPAFCFLTMILILGLCIAAGHADEQFELGFEDELRARRELYHHD